MTLAEAQIEIERGVEYGAVCELIPEADRPALAEWFCHTAGLPNLTGRVAMRSRAPSENLCRRCGGLMVRTGTCETCQSCGESSGGCG